ncbi:MAG: response regulator transcription factor [Anaerolineales bacterium]|jgi:two-component system KDP operon response regulator KdpE
MQVIAACKDPEERDFIAHTLHRAGFNVQLKADPAKLAARWSEHPADLVVLAGAPSRELVDSIKALRGAARAALIVLTEAPSESQICSLLQAGADLVLQTPIGPKLLASYCHALLRRSGGVPAFTLPTLDLGEIALDPSTRKVTLLDQPPTRLTQLEFRLLYTLMTHRGQVIPSEVIVERVWGYSGGGNQELVRGLISRLRAKIEPDPSHPKFVHTIPSVGYSFDMETP